MLPMSIWCYWCLYDVIDVYIDDVIDVYMMLQMYIYDVIDVYIYDVTDVNHVLNESCISDLQQ